MEETARIKSFLKVIDEPIVNIKKLMKLSWHGIPFSIRYIIWKYLLRYIPVEHKRVELVLKKKRNEYDSLQKMLSFEATEIELKTKKQIKLDLVRSTTEVPFLFHDKAQEIMERVLFLWALRHPASGYVQGINDLIVPLFVVLLQEYSPLREKNVFDDVLEDDLKKVEADLYWCLSLLLEHVQDHYTSNQSKIFEQLTSMKQLIIKIDQPLASHFEENNVECFQFAFRWFNCFLLREMSLEKGLRLWDTYLSDEDGNGFSQFHLYVCVAIIEKYSSKLMNMEFAEIMQFLQNLPSEEWTKCDMDALLSEAFILYKRFSSSDTHQPLSH
ncbi:Rab GTPase activating protein, putative [Entamoeba histolytica HM-1:IMSS-B]|uniref:Rab GTPase activating protein, putative n=5 Tax=Entamoeba histolytica TaxID=5759 RepID=C4LVB7_ENTH1|nr:Rab GTPase activating protein, putative [Entamoeba histolytica HM-1:IMSS]EMD42444.1 Rab GTPase activating protein, putative [Entamoeba histolytica KU27]EMH73144.1 Rab GTPase activating protein, putative [Entamoeba histolytica HM-1:IMSS-B]EMS16217.1 Rab GTPase activating protein, putative [Entamoeba histolytica HM-3:IMSS]GAT92603.1 Rab GTPase activating protein putative [Entamoeba histolytica]EAL47753.1 Rab GTPase activating protein, putative [Entamoeba histolytica HM-1:IMSS]|eukprot:XP_653139.1 Rab GTPase activating protein, putative [Entamoeba histolytica HM-1:IMSS]